MGMRRILLGCYEIPGYGGASTSTYGLFQIMQDNGLDVHFLNIIDPEDADFFRYVFGEGYGNPKSLPNVHNCVLQTPLFHAHPELTALIEAISPDVLVGVGYIAALIMKRAALEKPLAFLPSGCAQVKHYIASNRVKSVIELTQRLQNSLAPPLIVNSNERDAVKLSDFVITHSYLIKELFHFFFPTHIGKIYSQVVWRAEWIYKNTLEYADLRRPFFEREIDVLFIASDWGRPEKNVKFVKEIVSRLRRAKIHIVGENSPRLGNAIHHSLLTKREELFTLMGNAKTLVSPSTFDPAPGILFEASAMGCNIIASKNCGNWMLCHDDLLVDPFNLAGFLEKIALSLTTKFDDNMDYFLKTNAYEDLVETLQVL